MPYYAVGWELVYAALTTTLSVLVLRATPTLVVLSSSDSCGTWHKLCALVGYFVLAYLAVTFANFRAIELGAAYAYLGAASMLPYFLRKLLGSRLPRWMLLASILGIFVVIPGSYEERHVLLLILGWEASLSAYSYCVDSRDTRDGLLAYWFFVFVNPTLAYRHRGKIIENPRLSRAGLARIAKGTAAILLSVVLGSFGARVAVQHETLPAWIGTALRLAAIYPAHLGLAAMQIGLFRLLGHEAPERYVRPHLAVSPRDFWARWNTYVGAWIRCYVFEPIVASMIHTLPEKRHRPLIRAVAIGASFVSVGALHDLYSTLFMGKISASMTVWFAANALVLLIWDAVASQRTKHRTGYSPGWASVAGMLGVVVTLAAVFPLK